MSMLDTGLLAGTYSRSVSTAAVSAMSPANGDTAVVVSTSVSVDVIGIPDTADTELLLYNPDVGTIVIYSGGAFGAGASDASVVLAGGVYTFEFTPTVELPYRETIEVGVYDIGVEIGLAEFYTEVDPEVLSGWQDTKDIEAYFGVALSNFPNMESFRAAMVAASVSDPLRTDIAYKRLTELLHLTELGDLLASRNTYVVPQQTGVHRSVSTSCSALLQAARTNERYLMNGLDELALSGLSPFWLELIKEHYAGPSFVHRISAVSLALHLAVILQNGLT